MRANGAPANPRTRAAAFTRDASETKTRVSQGGMRIFELIFVEEAGVERAGEDLVLDSGTIYAWRSCLREHRREIAPKLEVREASDWPGAKREAALAS